jgi:hypothetical protein
LPLGKEVPGAGGGDETSEMSHCIEVYEMWVIPRMNSNEDVNRPSAMPTENGRMRGAAEENEVHFTRKVLALPDSASQKLKLISLVTLLFLLSYPIPIQAPEERFKMEEKLTLPDTPTRPERLSPPKAGGMCINF